MVNYCRYYIANSHCDLLSFYITVLLLLLLLSVCSFRSTQRMYSYHCCFGKSYFHFYNSFRLLPLKFCGINTLSCSRFFIDTVKMIVISKIFWALTTTFLFWKKIQYYLMILRNIPVGSTNHFRRLLLPKLIFPFLGWCLVSRY